MSYNQGLKIAFRLLETVLLGLFLTSTVFLFMYQTGQWSLSPDLYMCLESTLCFSMITIPLAIGIHGWSRNPKDNSEG